MIMARLHTWQFGSFGACVNTLCFPEPKLGGGSGQRGSDETTVSLPEVGASAPTKCSKNSLSNPCRSCNGFRRAKLSSCTGFSKYWISLFAAVFSRAVSCGGRAELELEASLDRRGTTVGTELSVLHCICHQV